MLIAGISETEWLANYRREHEIHCPHCDAVYDDTDNPQCISYHGEDGPVEVECLNEECERVFLVVESVDRTYETKAVAPSPAREES